MILVIGGLNGFIGSNTTEALLNLEKDCVVTRHENTEVPGFLRKFIDHRHLVIEPADATSIADLKKIGEKHKIDGIVNVAGDFASGEGPLRGLQGYFDMLTGIFKMAQEWKVKRVTFSSTGDLIYIKDMARAIALLQTGEKLQYNVYNVGSGKLTHNREVVEAVKKVAPNFKVDLPPGHFPFPPLPIAETKRLQEDTGFSPKFNIQSAIQHYVDWLKAGNPK